MVEGASQSEAGMVLSGHEKALASGMAGVSVLLAIVISVWFLRKSWKMHFGQEPGPPTGVEGDLDGAGAGDEDPVTPERESAKEAQVLKSFTDDSEDSVIPLQEGEMCKVLNTEHNGWSHVRSRKGKKGFFPTAYLLIDPPGTPPSDLPQPISPMLRSPMPRKDKLKDYK